MSVFNYDTNTQKSTPLVFPELRDKLAAPHRPSRSEGFLGGLGVILHDSLTPDECRAVVDATEKIGYEGAKSYCFMYNNRWNDRFMADDAQLAEFLWERVKEYTPKRVEAFERTWEVDGLNSRFRFCKYIGGEGHYFGPHTDGMYTADLDHRSLFTCMFYLNGGQDFKGGLTNFIDHETRKVNHSIVPAPGLCVIFRQVDIRTYHEGTQVVSGLKYIMRTDVMYHAVS
jgi:prolyl 4-hydroxylase